MEKVIDKLLFDFHEDVSEHGASWTLGVERFIEGLNKAKSDGELWGSDGFVSVVGENIRNQDNRITADPIFAVQQKVFDLVPEGYEDSTEWRETESGDYCMASDSELDIIEKANEYDEDCITADNDEGEPTEWQKFYLRRRWEFVTCAFTEAGCKDYIKVNGHNLCEPRIYAYSGYRNKEWIGLRKHLASLPATPKETKT